MSIQSQMDSLSASLKSTATSKNDLKNAINVKTQLIDLQNKLFDIAEKNGDTELAHECKRQIQMLQEEIAQAKSDLKKDSNVFDSGSTVNEQELSKNSVWHNNIS